jgi:hypothetical protein
MPSYELRPFDGELKELAPIFEELRNDSAAKSRAAVLVRKNGGPVDLAYADGRDWNERYLTTAHPSDFHSNKVRFGRVA